jgi:hypothetical protein
MTDWSTIEIKGQVAEIFGNKFVLQDASGRALVETGHHRAKTLRLSPKMRL